jgi:hypothetical protein
MLSKFIPLLLAVCFSCKQQHTFPLIEMPQENQEYKLDNPYLKIGDIPLPNGFKRIQSPTGSFTEWLRNINLKKDKTVFKYDGTPKFNQSAQFAVLDISVGKQDLQQCADAVMRLRAEYLYYKKDFPQINFTDNNGRSYSYQPPYTRDRFDKYLLQVFGMCGSASLCKQLTRHIEMKNIEAGDVLIRGGFPGHAVIIMDVAANETGKKIYLVAQSYMPAQDIHVLVNPADKSLSPWYEVNDDTLIQTPEYTFSKHELKRW